MIEKLTGDVVSLVAKLKEKHPDSDIILVHGYCTTKPMTIPIGQTRDDVNRAWDVKHGIVRADNQ